MKDFRLYRILFIAIFVISGVSWAAEKDHAHESPHGGEVKTMGNYHVEFLIQQDGKVKVYLLDKNTKPLSAEGVEGLVYLRPAAGGGMKTVQLRPSADKAYLEGGINLKESPKFEAGVRLTIKGQKFTPVSFNYPGEHGEHAEAEHEKLSEAQLKQFFSQAQSFVAKHAMLSAAQTANIEKGLADYDKTDAKLSEAEKTVHAYLAKTKDSTLGVVIPINITSGGYRIKSQVGISADGKVAKVAVEDGHKSGVKLPSEGLLKQFIGKSVNDPIKVGKDITADKSEEPIAQGLTAGVKRSLLIWQQAKGTITSAFSDKEQAKGHSQ